MSKLSHSYVSSVIESEDYRLLSFYEQAYKKLKLRCPYGHHFEITWNSWKKGRRCPYCGGKVHYQEIYKSFEEEGYILLTKESDYKNTNQKLDYICKNGHKGSVSWKNWSKGVRCKQCFFDSRRYDFNVFKSELETEGYKLLSKETEYENRRSKLKIKCPFGHVYYSSRDSWKSGSRCPVCANIKKSIKQRFSYNYVKKEIENFGYVLKSKDCKNAFEKLLVICPNGHEYKVRWNDWQQGCRCPKCGRRSSKGEAELCSFLSSLVAIVKHDREIIKPYELDIVIPDRKIAIEYCGLYWHSELFVDKYYHLNKLEKCRSVNYNLITIFSDEWEFKKNIVKSKLKHILGISNAKKIYARNCSVKPINAEVKNKFLNEYHLQGKDISAINLGLFFDDVLVAVMTFSKGSIAKGNKPMGGVWELNRFAVHSDYQVVGGASKLLKYFINNYDWVEIFSFADRRWSEGNLYYNLGFVLDYVTSPNYWYSKDGLHRIHRFNLRKRSYEKGTESELRLMEGYFRIWDCGSLKFTLLKEDLDGKKEKI